MNLEHVDDKDSGKYVKLIGYGVVLWLVPFLVSFFLYTPQGTPILSVALFGKIMMVTITALTVVLLFKYFKNITADYTKEAMQVGIAWLVISVVLDVVILVPFAKMNLGTYFAEIATGYLVIPILAFFTGHLLEEKGNHSKKIFSQVASTKK